MLRLRRGERHHPWLSMDFLRLGEDGVKSLFVGDGQVGKNLFAVQIDVGGFSGLP